jgi:TctA family transporter
MEIFAIIGLTFIIGIILGNVLEFILALVLYPFDKRQYTHPKWKSLFPYIFTIEYKICLSQGVYLVHTNTPHIAYFFGSTKVIGYTLKREYTKEYLQSDSYKQLKKFSDSLNIK